MLRVHAYPAHLGLLFVFYKLKGLFSYYQCCKVLIVPRFVLIQRLENVIVLFEMVNLSRLRLSIKLAVLFSSRI